MKITLEPGYDAHVSWSNRTIRLENIRTRTTTGYCKIGELNAKIGRRAGGHKLLDRITIEEIELTDCSFEPNFDSQETQETRFDYKERILHFIKLIDGFSLPDLTVSKIICNRCRFNWRSGEFPFDLQFENLTGYYRPDRPADSIGIQTNLTYALGGERTYLRGKCAVEIKNDEDRPGSKKLVIQTKEQPIAARNGQFETLPNMDIQSTFFGLTRNGTHFNIQAKTDTPFEYSPLGISFNDLRSEFNGVLQVSRNTVQLFCQTNAQILNCTHDGEELELSPSADMRFRFAFDLVTGKITVDSLSGELQEKHGANLNIVQNGVVSFELQPDGSYSFEPNASSIHIFSADPIPLDPFDPITPIRVKGYNVLADYLIKLDPKAESISGTMDFGIVPQKKEHPEFLGKFKFETEGITEVRSFKIKESKLECVHEKRNLLKADLSGEYTFDELDLIGEIDYRPYELGKALGYDLTALAKTLKKVELNDVLHHAKGNIHIYLPQLDSTWNMTSSIEGLNFTDKTGEKVSTTLNGIGDFHYDKESAQWKVGGTFQCLSGEDISITVSYNASQLGQISGTATISHAKHHFMKQFMEKFFDETDYIGKLPLNELNFRCAYSWASGQDYPIVDQTSLVLTFQENENIEISEFSINPAKTAQDILQGDFTLKINDIPLSYGNAFLPADLASFEEGKMTGEFHCTHPEGSETLHLEGEAKCFDVISCLDERTREFKKIAMGGKADYSFKDSKITLSNFFIDLEDTKGGKIAFFEGSGIIVPNEKSADFSLSEVRCGPEILNYIRYCAQKSFAFDRLEAIGKVDYHIRDGYGTHTMEGEFELKHVQLSSSNPDVYQFPDLHGKLGGMFSWVDSEFCLYGDATVELLDENNKKIASGAYLHTPDRGGIPYIESDTVDLGFALAYFNYNIPANPNWIEGDEYEPPEFYTFPLQFDLEGLYAGKEYEGAAQFIMEFSDHTMRVKDLVLSGLAAGDGTAIFDFSNKKTEYHICPHLRDIQIEKAMALCSEFGFNINMEGLTGSIADVDGELSGKGFSTEDYRRELEFDFDIKMGKIDYDSKSSNHNKSIYTLFLEIPLVLVPRFIDLLPIDTLKNILKLATASSFLDVLTGNKALSFKNGDAKLKLKEGVLHIENMELNGQSLDTFRAAGTINLLTDEQIDLVYSCQFGELIIPLYLYGNYKDPDLNETKSFIHFWSENTTNLLMLVPNLIMFNEDNILLKTIQSSEDEEE